MISAARGSVLHQQALSVMGFFTGLVLTSLVLILNSPRPFHVALGPLSPSQYYQVLTTYVAVVGAFSSVAMLAYLEVAGGLSGVYSFVDKFGTTLFLTSVFGFQGIIPLLLVSYTRWGALAVLLIEIVLNSIYFIGRRVGPGATRATS